MIRAVVADTSPLNYLVLIGHIDLLAELFGTVYVPPEVVTELSDEGASELVREWIVSPPNWLSIATATSLINDPTGTLDLGERAAISLALQTGNSLLIVDDATARKEALRLGLQVTGTLGVLKQASVRGLVDLHDAIGRLTQTSFHVSPELLRKFFE